MVPHPKTLAEDLSQTGFDVGGWGKWSKCSSARVQTKRHTQLESHETGIPIRFMARMNHVARGYASTDDPPGCSKRNRQSITVIRTAKSIVLTHTETWDQTPQDIRQTWGVLNRLELHDFVLDMSLFPQLMLG